METENNKRVFLDKCFHDMQKLRAELLEALNKSDLQKIDLLTYKHTMCLEIYDLLEGNGSASGLNSYIKIYGNKENPLYEIFFDYISKNNEPKLMTSNKLLRFLEKI